MEKYLGLDIQLFGTDPQGDPQREPAVNEPTEGLPKTIDDFNKAIQSASSKAKNDILKEIGIEKVADIKALVEKGKTYDEISAKYEEVNKNHETLTKEREETDAKIKELEASGVSLGVENSLLKYGVQSKRIERAKGIVLTDLKNGVELPKAIEELVKEFPEWISSTTQVGADLNPDNSTLTEREKYYKEQGYTE